MGIGFGDILAQGIIGAVGGGAQGAYTQALLEQKDEMEKLREERLSKLRTTEHATNMASDIAAKKASEDADATQRAAFYQRTQMAPTTTTSTYTDNLGDEGEGAAAGSEIKSTTTPTRRDQADYRLEEAKKTGRADLIAQSYAESKDVRADEDQQRKLKLEETKVDADARHSSYYDAAANRMNAEAEAIRNGEKYKKGADKIQLPNIKVERDQASGMTYSVDANSGAVGVMQPAEKGSPPQTRSAFDPTSWFGDLDKGTPDKPARMVWSLHGQVLQNGLADIYPDIKKRLTNSAAARDTAAGASGDPGPAIEAEIRGGSDAASAPAPRLPRAGDIVSGYRFKGGNPRDKANWEKAR